MIKAFREIMPKLDESTFVADTAVVTGNTQIGAASSVWFGAVIRGDSDPITIGNGTNIQDNATVHSSQGYPVSIGNNVSVGHNAVVHGCTVGDNTLVGMNSTILNGAKIGKNCIIGAGALVTENKEFPDNTLIIGVPARAVRPLGDNEINGITANAAHYSQLAEEYLKNA